MGGNCSQNARDEKYNKNKPFKVFKENKDFPITNRTHDVKFKCIDENLHRFQHKEILSHKSKAKDEVIETPDINSTNVPLLPNVKSALRMQGDADHIKFKQNYETDSILYKSIETTSIMEQKIEDRNSFKKTEECAQKESLMDQENICVLHKMEDMNTNPVSPEENQCLEMGIHQVTIENLFLKGNSIQNKLGNEEEVCELKNKETDMETSQHLSIKENMCLEKEKVENLVSKVNLNNNILDEKIVQNIFENVSTKEKSINNEKIHKEENKQTVTDEISLITEIDTNFQEHCTLSDTVDEKSIITKNNHLDNGSKSELSDDKINMLDETSFIKNKDALIQNTEDENDTTNDQKKKRKIVKAKKFKTSVTTAKQERESDEYDKFLLFADNINNNKHLDKSIDDQNSDSSNCIPENEPLFIQSQMVGCGRIINRSIFITEAQWHTLVFVDDDTIRCFVCDIYFDEGMILNHFKSPIHEESMELYKPLAKHNLHMIRQVSDRYHCGICNEVIEIADIKNHLKSPSHHDNYLYAINKVSEPSSEVFTEKINLTLDSDPNVDTKDGNEIGFWDKKYVEMDIASGMTYSSALKEVPVRPSTIRIQIKGVNVTVDFLAWNMIILTGSNKYYCMLCLRQGMNYLIYKHCLSDNHSIKLKACQVLDYESPPILRQLDFKFFHCTACNDIDLMNESDNHFKKHITENANNVFEETLRLEAANDICETNFSKLETKIDNCETNPNNTSNNLRVEVKDLLDYEACVKIKMPNLEMVVSNLSYNMIQNLHDGRLCCFLCKMIIFKGNLRDHLSAKDHKRKLKECLFVEDYKQHMLRMIASKLHCCVCNIIFNHSEKEEHLLWKEHMELTSRSKNCINNKKHPSIVISQFRQYEMCNDDVSGITIESDWVVSDRVSGDESDEVDEMQNLRRKMIIVNGDVLIVNWKKWHCIRKVSNDCFRCLMCCCDFVRSSVLDHVNGNDHQRNIYQCRVEEQYAPSLIRKLSDARLNCISCHSVLSTPIYTHLKSPKHINILDKLYAKSFTVDTYTDCFDDPLVIDALAQSENGKMEVFANFSVQNSRKMVIFGDYFLYVPWIKWHCFWWKEDLYRCNLCIEIFHRDLASQHINDHTHRQKLHDSKFDLNYKPALLRIVDNSKINCVTCNTIIGNKSIDLEQHVQLNEHIINLLETLDPNHSSLVLKCDNIFCVQD